MRTSWRLIGNKFFFSFLVLIPWNSLKAQFDQNYQPFTFSGQIPQEVLIDAKEKTENTIDESDNSLKVKDQKALYTNINYELSEVLLSGSVYYNDVFSEYVSKVVDQLLINEPEKRKKLKVYITKFPEMNAVCWGDGTIFVNIGLLAKIRNEAQLAYILSHEISHYFCKHSIKQFKENRKIEENLNKGKETEAVFKKLRFSRSNEFEADLKGFELFAQSPYSGKEAIDALRSLETSGAEKFSDTLNLKNLFYSEALTLNKKYFLEEKESKTIGKYKKNKSQESKKNADDLDPSTHPSIQKRVEAIQEALTKTTCKGNMIFLNGEELFKRIQTMADFELARNNYEDANFEISFFEALQLQKKYPKNEYLHGLLCQNIYWLYQYKESRNLGNILANYHEIDQKPLAQLLYFLEKINSEDLLKVSYQFIKNENELFSHNETILIMMAEITEDKDGLEKASKFYSRYITEFPSGKHVNYAKNKIHS